LGQVLGLPAPPERIEGFDISNISGTFKVASLVSFRHGRPDRANYRKFRIKTVEGQDDFASVAEVVRRRNTRVLNESKGQSPNSKVEDQGDEPTSPAEPTERPSGDIQTEPIAHRPSPIAHREESPVPDDLQRMVDDVSAAVRGNREPTTMSDAAGGDIRDRR